MKRLIFVSIFLLALAMFTSFGPSDPPHKYRQLGDTISTQAQQVLLKNLVSAIQRNKTAGAVAFCSERAMLLTDSLSREHKVQIQRISLRNRNPRNKASKLDKQILSQFAAIPSLKDTVVKTTRGHIFYKPIKIAMPTCLQCHGNPASDIEPSTLRVIQQKYPADKATGYKMLDLRGVWRVSFTK